MNNIIMPILNNNTYFIILLGYLFHYIIIITVKYSVKFRLFLHLWGDIQSKFFLF